MYNSRKVLQAFQRLLVNSSNGDTIKVEDLPSLLGVKRTDWIFECYDGDLRLTRDGRAVFTLPAWERVMRELEVEAERGFVDLAQFARRKHVAVESIPEEDLESRGLSCWVNDHSAGLGSVGTREQVKNVRSRLRSIATTASDREIDLRNAAGLSEVPIALLRVFVAELQKGASQLQGEFKDRDDSIIFVAFAHTEAQREKERLDYQTTVQRLAHELQTKSYVHLLAEQTLDTEQLRQDVSAQYKTEHPGPDSGISLLDLNDGTRAIALEKATGEALEDMRSKMKPFARDTNDERSRDMNPALEASLISTAKQSDLARLLLKSQHRTILDTTWMFLLDEADNEERAQFNKHFQEIVMAPLHLYAMAVTGDSTLMQNQDAYISTFFRQDVIPGFFQRVTEQRFALVSRYVARGKEADQLLDFCRSLSTEGRPKSLKDVQSAVARFAKKRQIAYPDAAQIDAVKKETLLQKGRSIRKMTRGSDVLQNLIWILFAEAREGLFISAGKDTSRMIEQYRSVGDFEKWQKLQRWRDLLKAGKAEEEDVRMMKDLAMEILKEMDISTADGNLG